MFYGSSPMDICVSSFLIDSGCLSRGCRESPGGESLSFASPKESNQRKGDPQSGPLRGSLEKLKEPENLETSLLRSRRTSRFFNPSPSAFSSPARTGWGNSRSQSASLHFRPLPEGQGVKFDSEFISPQPLERRRGAQEKADQGAHLFERSEFVRDPAFSEHRSVPVAKRRDDEQGRLSFAYFSLAKQRKVSCRRASPGTLRQAAGRNPTTASATRGQ
jgi:hypothetical protein